MNERFGDASQRTFFWKSTSCGFFVVAFFHPMIDVFRKAGGHAGHGTPTMPFVASSDISRTSSYIAGGNFHRHGKHVDGDPQHRCAGFRDEDVAVLRVQHEHAADAITHNNEFYFFIFFI